MAPSVVAGTLQGLTCLGSYGDHRIRPGNGVVTRADKESLETNVLIAEPLSLPIVAPYLCTDATGVLVQALRSVAAELPSSAIGRI
jgi:hypothetical protein